MKSNSKRPCPQRVRYPPPLPCNNLFVGNFPGIIRNVFSYIQHNWDCLAFAKTCRAVHAMFVHLVATSLHGHRLAIFNKLPRPPACNLMDPFTVRLDPRFFVQSQAAYAAHIATRHRVLFEFLLIYSSLICFLMSIHAYNTHDNFCGLRIPSHCIIDC